MTTAFSTLDMRTYLSYLATKKQIIAKAETEEDEEEKDDDEESDEEKMNDKRKNTSGDGHDVQRRNNETESSESM